MELFTQTTDSLFTGALADEAKFRANMAEMFNYKIEYSETKRKIKESFLNFT
jgi:hemoglobin